MRDDRVRDLEELCDGEISMYMAFPGRNFQCAQSMDTSVTVCVQTPSSIVAQRECKGKTSGHRPEPRSIPLPLLEIPENHISSLAKLTSYGGCCP